jgi:hypothetical protein
MCEFFVEYEVPSSYLEKNAAREFTLNYNFRAAKPMEDKTGKAYWLELPASSVHYYVNNSPSIFPVSLAKMPNFLTDGRTLEWKGTLVFRDTSKMIDWSGDIKTDGFKITCEDPKKEIEVDPQLNISASQQTAEMTLAYDTGSAAMFNSMKDSGGDSQKCNLIGSMNFVAKPHGIITRNVSFQIRLPKEKVAQPGPISGAVTTANADASTK